MKLKLVELSYEYKRQLFEMLDEWVPYNKEHSEANHSPWAIFKNDYHDFDNYLANLDYKEPKDCNVITTTYFCLDEDRDIFVGAANIRHYFNMGLLEDGGHIGDGVRPSERRKGIATKMIALALEKCKEIGLKRVMITCDTNNIGSKKSILNNGGVFENKFNDDERYWIELEPYNRLEGDKIVLRKPKLSDLDSMLNNVWSNPTVYNTMLYTPIKTKEEAYERLLKSVNFQNTNYAYFITIKETDEPIGICGIKEKAKGVFHECGLGISGRYHGLGYGKEALALLLDLVFNKLNANEFQYGLCKGNEKSRRLIRKYPFKQIDSQIKHREWDNKDFEIEEYSLSRENYLNNK